ncbi:VOC family protein [Streptomyces profundus]|uniref:VOC family protein n=1 Tax=Streptomyces profundus TaxID=2867410 RepID=UPI001D1610A0|nr:VOC family protein [Streptomyces sp. MA3_2.13]UED84840.1 VOC family protein [Streptomyces sp. MA3_2.13]
MTHLSYEVFHKDVPTLVEFYVRVLGFRAPEESKSSEVSETSAPLEYVVVRRGDVRVGCCRHDEADPTPRRPPGGSEIVLRVDDVRAEHARVVSSGWPLADALRTRPWGLTDFRVFDPAGQYLRITSATAEG